MGKVVVCVGRSTNVLFPICYIACVDKCIYYMFIIYNVFIDFDQIWNSMFFNNTKIYTLIGQETFICFALIIGANSTF